MPPTDSSVPSGTHTLLSCIVRPFVFRGVTHLRAALLVLPWQVPCCSVSHKSLLYRAILLPCDSWNYGEQSRHDVRAWEVPSANHHTEAAVGSRKFGLLILPDKVNKDELSIRLRSSEVWQLLQWIRRIQVSQFHVEDHWLLIKSCCSCQVVLHAHWRRPLFQYCCN